MKFTQTVIKIKTLTNHSFAAIRREYEDGSVKFGEAVSKRGQSWKVYFTGMNESQVRAFVRGARELFNATEWTSNKA